MEPNKTTDFEIISVMPTPPGTEANFLGIVSFAFSPSKHRPLVFERSSKKGDEWRRYPEVEIYGAASVQVRTSFLKTSKKGELYIQTNSLALPWDLRVRIAEEALKRING